MSIPETNAPIGPITFEQDNYNKILDKLAENKIGSGRLYVSDNGELKTTSRLGFLWKQFASFFTDSQETNTENITKTLRSLLEVGQEKKLFNPANAGLIKAIAEKAKITPAAIDQKTAVLNDKEYIQNLVNRISVENIFTEPNTASTSLSNRGVTNIPGNQGAFGIVIQNSMAAPELNEAKPTTATHTVTDINLGKVSTEPVADRGLGQKALQIAKYAIPVIAVAGLISYAAAQGLTLSSASELFNQAQGMIAGMLPDLSTVGNANTVASDFADNISSFLGDFTSGVSNFVANSGTLNYLLPTSLPETLTSIPVPTDLSGLPNVAEGLTTAANETLQFFNNTTPVLTEKVVTGLDLSGMPSLLAAAPSITAAFAKNTSEGASHVVKIGVDTLWKAMSVAGGLVLGGLGLKSKIDERRLNNSSEVSELNKIAAKTRLSAKDSDKLYNFALQHENPGLAGKALEALIALAYTKENARGKLASLVESQTKTPLPEIKEKAIQALAKIKEYNALATVESIQQSIATKSTELQKNLEGLPKELRASKPALAEAFSTLREKLVKASTKYEGRAIGELTRDDEAEWKRTTPDAVEKLVDGFEDQFYVTTVLAGVTEFKEKSLEVQNQIKALRAEVPPKLVAANTLEAALNEANGVIKGTRPDIEDASKAMESFALDLENSIASLDEAIVQSDAKLNLQEQLNQLEYGSDDYNSILDLAIAQQKAGIDTRLKQLNDFYENYLGKLEESGFTFTPEFDAKIKNLVDVKKEELNALLDGLEVRWLNDPLAPIEEVEITPLKDLTATEFATYTKTVADKMRLDTKELSEDTGITFAALKLADYQTAMMKMTQLRTNLIVQKQYHLLADLDVAIEEAETTFKEITSNLDARALKEFGKTVEKEIYPSIRDAYNKAAGAADKSPINNDLFKQIYIISGKYGEEFALGYLTEFGVEKLETNLTDLIAFLKKDPAKAQLLEKAEALQEGYTEEVDTGLGSVDEFIYKDNFSLTNWQTYSEQIGQLMREAVFVPKK